MSKYTTELRYICEWEAGLDESAPYTDTHAIIAAAAPKIFSFSFPVFDESYRQPLEEKIIRHFYTREIGSETYGLWKLRLEAKMNEIMPYYNKLYQSAALEYDPLHDVDYTVTGNSNGTDTGNSTSNSNSNSNSTVNSHQYGEKLDYDLYSDTPQGALDGVESETYLTNVHKYTNDDSTTGEATTAVTGSDKNTTTSTKDSTKDYTERVTGKRGGQSYSKMIEEYRQQLLNVDLMVIRELDELFMLIW